MRKFYLILIMSFVANAEANLVYCHGQIVDLITRNSSQEATHVKLKTNNGDTGYARVGSSVGYNDFQKIQFSMLLSAFMAGKPVTLELNTSGYTFTSCTDFQVGLPVRNVRLRK